MSSKEIALVETLSRVVQYVTSLSFRIRALSLVRKQGVAQFYLSQFQDHNISLMRAIEKRITFSLLAGTSNKTLMSRNNMRRMRGILFFIILILILQPQASCTPDFMRSHVSIQLEL